MKRKMNVKIGLIMSILLILFSGLTAFGQVNLALGKRATQSSDMGTPFKSTDGLASKAVDGNTDGVFNNGSVTHTACGGQYESGACKGTKDPWWQVDLGAVYQVDKIELWNRTEVPERLTNFRVYVKGTTGDWQEFSPGLGVYIRQNPRTIYGSKQARYIRVQLEGEGVFLSLAEVRVFGNNGKTFEKPRQASEWKNFCTGVVTGVNYPGGYPGGGRYYEFMVNPADTPSFYIYAPQKTDQYVEKGKRYTGLMLTKKDSKAQAFILVNFDSPIDMELKNKLMNGVVPPRSGQNYIMTWTKAKPIQAGDTMFGQAITRDGIVTVQFNVRRGTRPVAMINFSVHPRTPN